MIGRDTNSRTEWVAALAGLILTIVVYYPGFISPDSIEQLREARAGAYSDWHPPVMSWVWARFDSVVPGPFGIMTLHAALFWAGVACFCGEVFSGRRAKAIAVLSLGLLPPVFAYLGTVWKDVAMASALVFATGILMRATRRGISIVGTLMLLPTLLYAFSVRHDAALAVLPILFWAASIPAMPRKSRYGVLIAGASLFLLMAMMSRVAGSALTEGPPSLAGQWILTHDLVAINAETGDNLFPASMRPKADMSREEWRALYSPQKVESIYKQSNPLHITPTQDAFVYDELKSLWLAAVMKHPGVYLTHRARMFAHQWGFEASVCYPFQTGIEPNDLGVATERTTVGNAAVAILERLSDTIFFRGWLYLLLAVTGLAISFARNWNEGIALATSSLLYGLPHFFIATTADFRLIWWSVVSALLSSMLLLGRNDIATNA